jgi:hypothetical protein
MTHSKYQNPRDPKADFSKQDVVLPQRVDHGFTPEQVKLLNQVIPTQLPYVQTLDHEGNLSATTSVLSELTNSHYRLKSCIELLAERIRVVLSTGGTEPLCKVLLSPEDCSPLVYNLKRKNNDVCDMEHFVNDLILRLEV